MGRNSWVRVFAVAAIAACLVLTLGVVAHAQPPEPWSDPVMISSGLLDEAGQPLSSSFPTMAADPWGSVHLFWTRIPREEDVSFEGLIFYSRWDGRAWTSPVDILAQREAFWLPQVVADQAGQLHLAWMGGTGGAVLYSTAPLELAGSARAWSTPLRVSDIGATGFGLAVDREQRGHVVFCSGGDDDRCYHAAHVEGGFWEVPVSIFAPCDDCMARIAIDDQGRIHATFGSIGAGGAQYYSRSDDGGATWLPAQEFDRADDRFSEPYGPCLGTVAAVGQAEVHIVWFGAPAGQRWHRGSTDGGVTWSEAQLVSADHRGLTQPVAAAFDSEGALHLISMGWRDVDGRPSGAFHFTWQDGRWSQPALIGSRADWDAEYAAAAVSGGNRLVAAWTDKEGPKGTFQIWGSILQLDASPLVPVTRVAAAASSASPPADPEDTQPSTGATGAAQARTPISRSPGVSTEGLGARSAGPEWITYLLGALPPLALLALVLVVRAARQRRGG